jgi:hypothetical protein
LKNLCNEYKVAFTLAKFALKMPLTATAVLLALSSLGTATQILVFISHVMSPKEVKASPAAVAAAGIFAKTICQCKCRLNKKTCLKNLNFCSLILVINVDVLFLNQRASKLFNYPQFCPKIHNLGPKLLTFLQLQLMLRLLSSSGHLVHGSIELKTRPKQLFCYLSLAPLN